MGGGCELALACDIVIAADTALFGMPETAVGLVPGFGVLRAPAVIGRQWTKLMMFAGERVDAASRAAHRAGAEGGPGGRAAGAARALALRVAAGRAAGGATGKAMVNRGVERGEIDHSTAALTDAARDRGHRRGHPAFLGSGRRSSRADEWSRWSRCMRRYVVDYTNRHDTRCATS